MASGTDYYPFVLQIPGRYWCDNNSYCNNATITEPIDNFFNPYYDFVSLAYRYPLVYFGFTGSVTPSYATSLSGDLVFTTGTQAGNGVTMTADSRAP